MKRKEYMQMLKKFRVLFFAVALIILALSFNVSATQSDPRIPVSIGNQRLNGYLIEEKIEVTRVEAESVVAGSCKICRPRYALVLIAEEPFGFFACHSFVKARGKVYGCFNAYLVRRFYLLAQKVEAKTGMHLICFGGVICPAVMAFGKECYRIEKSINFCKCNCTN